MTISLCIANVTDDDRVDLGGVTVDGQPLNSTHQTEAGRTGSGDKCSSHACIN